MERTYPHPICGARNFLEAFERACSSEPTPWRQFGSSKYSEWTAWFARMINKIAIDAGSLHCQSKHATRPGEWLAVDHIIMRENSYGQFPLVVAEHENGDLGTIDGSLPDPWSTKACIEWAFWKAITVRSFLSVMVSYPYKRDQSNVLKVFGEMATSWKNHFGHAPNCLCLFGWWAPGNRPVNEADLYEPYIAVPKGERIELIPLT